MFHCAFVCVCVRACACVRARARVCASVCLCACVCACVRACVRGQLQLDAENARTEKERARIDLDAARLQGKEDKLLGERKLTAIEHDKGQEVLALKAELADRSQDAKAQVQKLQVSE